MISFNVKFNAQRVIASLTKETAQAVRLVSKDLLESLKKFTPVKTGRAQRGWKERKKGSFGLHSTEFLNCFSTFGCFFSRGFPKEGGIKRHRFQLPTQ